MALDKAQVPLRWRSHPERGRESKTIYQFVREYLARDGMGNRSDLLNAMMADPSISTRLARSQGFVRILWNMRNSGWIELDGERITPTRKTLRKERGAQRGG